MLAALAAAGYSEPTPIQAGLIPRALAGVDVLGQARTGTGKTAAFTIPILEQIDVSKKHSGPQALVLVPTRELAVQVREEVVKLAHGRKFHPVALYGGKPIRGQIDKLRRGAEVVIGTPGRVLDHLARGTLELRDLKIIVLDEADRMLDIGFRPDIEKILRRCPQSRQTLLLSATVPPPVERLSKRYMRDPETLNFSPKDVAVETIEQFYFTVDANRKFELLEKLLQREQPRQAIIFCRTKRGTEKIYQRLSKRLTDAATIHGDLAQNVRDRVMAAFRAGEVRYLVATDVVGRGIDVTNISHIINYDLPQFCDDYVHRVGRTGRMGREGVAFSFVTPEEGNELTRIEMRINRLLKREEMPGISSVGKLADTSGIPAHSGPMQWTPGAGWGGGESNAPKPAADTTELSPTAESNDAAPPSPGAPAKKAGKRYRRAL
jgi:ATP-dependent RNA helicase DeaD